MCFRFRCVRASERLCGCMREGVCVCVGGVCERECVEGVIERMCVREHMQVCDECVFSRSTDGSHQLV